MPAHDDMFHLQHIDGELHHGKTVKVRVYDHVRDVPVDEQFAGEKVHNLIRRHPAVGASDPQILGRLLP